MRTFNILLFLIVISVLSCKEKIKKVEKDYILKNEAGISVEQFDSTNEDQNRYTKNNSTFKEGVIFTYDFEHITPTKKKLLFTWDASVKDYMKSWKFVSSDSINEKTIDKVAITVRPGLEPMIKNNPDYNQTIIQYEYLIPIGKAPFLSSSGVIENEDNIWMHPPRDKYFSILEINPFPFIKTPYEIGNEWTWTLNIGDGWSDKRWKTWEGQIENKYKYKITGMKNIKTNLGVIECFVIESTANSRIGETKLMAFFNPEYGFVQLNYTNIDGSLTNLKLSDYYKN